MGRNAIWKKGRGSKSGVKVNRSRKNLYKRRKSTGRKIFEAVVLIIVAGALVLLGYSIASPLIKFFSGQDAQSSSEPAWTPPQSQVESTDENSSDITSESETSSQDSSEPKPERQKLSAVTAPNTALSSENALKKYLEQAKADGYNTVIFNLKNETGELLYKSSLKSVKDNAEIVKGTLSAYAIAKACEEAGITPAASVSTLLDKLTPYLEKGYGYLAEDGGWTWLDNYENKGGKPWVTPYSEGAVNYLASICTELAKAGFDEIILQNTMFPAFRASDYKLVESALQSESRSEKLAQLAQKCAEKAMAANPHVRVSAEINASDLVCAEATEYDKTAEILASISLMPDCAVTINMDLSLAGKKLTLTESKTVTLSSDKAQAASQVMGLVKKEIGTDSIAVRLTDSTELSPDAAEKIRQALIKTGFEEFIA